MAPVGCLEQQGVWSARVSGHFAIRPNLVQNGIECKLQLEKRDNNKKLKSSFREVLALRSRQGQHLQEESAPGRCSEVF